MSILVSLEKEILLLIVIISLIFIYEFSSLNEETPKVGKFADLHSDISAAAISHEQYQKDHPPTEYEKIFSTYTYYESHIIIGRGVYADRNKNTFQERVSRSSSINHGKVYYSCWLQVRP